MKKAVLAIIILSILCNALCIKVYAESSLHKDFINKTGGIVYNVWTGRMTPEEASVELEYLNLVYESQLPDSDIEQIKSILPYITNGLAQADVGMILAICDTLDLLGLDISGYWDDYATDNGLQGTTNVDLNGYGAVCYGFDGDVLRIVYYADYIVYPHIDSAGNIGFWIYGDCWRTRYYDDGSLWSDESYSSRRLNFNSDYTYKFYGDIRKQDGTASDEKDEIITTPPQLENQDEDTMKDFVTEFMEQLPYMYPDLSTIEGLLQSIYNMLGTLDSDDDNTLLSTINLAICSLASDNHSDNAQIIALLSEIKESITGEGTTEESTEYMEQLKQINESLDYLCLISTLDLTVDSIDTVLELTEEERLFLDEYATLIVSMSEKFAYYPIATAIQSIESIIFTDKPPADFTVKAFGTDITVLDADMINGEGFKQGLNVAQIFCSVIILTGWLYAMRRKVAGGMTA